jgi:hypothetical protein
VTKTESERVTYSQLQELPWSRHRYHELFDGELITHDSRIDRRPVSGLWTFLLDLHFRNQIPVPCTRDEWYVNEHNAFRPDVVFPRWETFTAPTGEVRSRKVFPPVLAIDMLEPPNCSPEPRRLLAYARARLDWYWVVDSSVPSYTILERVDQTFVERAVIRRGDVFAVEDPFPIKLCPNDQLA